MLYPINKLVTKVRSVHSLHRLRTYRNATSPNPTINAGTKAKYLSKLKRGSTMIFIGSGGLLSAAVYGALSAGAQIDAVCCPTGDSCLPRIRNLDVVWRDTDDPNAEVQLLLKKSQDRTVFSINNRTILGDSLLSCDAMFFNIHNGLIQSYRGIGEVCVFAALCNGERFYGVTLHQLLPGQKVDSGPVVDQIEFPIDGSDGFFDVMSKSLEASQEIFLVNFSNITNNTFHTKHVKAAETAYSYKDIPHLCANAQDNNLFRASDFGPYGTSLPEMVRLIKTSTKT